MSTPHSNPKSLKTSHGAVLRKKPKKKRVKKENNIGVQLTTQNEVKPKVVPLLRTIETRKLPQAPLVENKSSGLVQKDEDDYITIKTRHGAIIRKKKKKPILEEKIKTKSTLLDVIESKAEEESEKVKKVDTNIESQRYSFKNFFSLFGSAEVKKEEAEKIEKTEETEVALVESEVPVVLETKIKPEPVAETGFLSNLYEIFTIKREKKERVVSLPKAEVNNDETGSGKLEISTDLQELEVKKVRSRSVIFYPLNFELAEEVQILPQLENTIVSQEIPIVTEEISLSKDVENFSKVEQERVHDKEEENIVDNEEEKLVEKDEGKRDEIVQEIEQEEIIKLKPKKFFRHKVDATNPTESKRKKSNLRNSLRGMKKLANFWDDLNKKNMAKQEINPFSQRFKGSKQFADKSVLDSKSDERAKKAQEWTNKEIDRVVQVIKDYGSVDEETKQTRITFGELFLIYEKISDTLVFMLIKARKRKRVFFDAGEMLLQGRDDHVFIYVKNE